MFILHIFYFVASCESPFPNLLEFSVLDDKVLPSSLVFYDLLDYVGVLISFILLHLKIISIQQI